MVLFGLASTSMLANIGKEPRPAFERAIGPQAALPGNGAGPLFSGGAGAAPFHREAK